MHDLCIHLRPLAESGPTTENSTESKLATCLSVFIPHAGLKAGADMGVAPHVHGLLLGPHELSIGVAPQLPLHQVKGERHQLQQHHHSFS